MSIRGTCEDLCSKTELELRTREKLLNFFEWKNGQKNVPGTLVGEFSRSAAGNKRPKKFELRTEGALNRTVTYLLQHVVMDKRRPFPHVYDFIFDRLRSVRQEIVIQDFSVVATVRLLEPIVMFLAYSRYVLCEDSVDDFDPKICEQHLQECLKRVCCCYDDLDERADPKEQPTIRLEKVRVFIEALYQIFNLGSPEALQRSFKLPEAVKEDALFRKVQRISIDYFCRNYHRVMLGIQELPHLLCAIGSLKFQLMRRNILEMFAHAYNSKQLEVPVKWLAKILNLGEIEVKKDCTYYNLELSESKNSVKFVKTAFQVDKSILKAFRESYVEDKLKKLYLPELLLLKKF